MDIGGVQGPMQIKQEWFDDLFELLDITFRPDSKRSMRTDFPFYLRKANAKNLFVCRAERQVICHVGYMPVTLSFLGHPVKIGMVGALATDEAWRGKGLATKTLHHLFKKACHRGVCMLMISGNRGLYLRNGARPLGNFAEYSLPVDNIPDQRLTVQSAHPDDAVTMSNLYKTKPFRFIRPLEMWQKLIDAQICRNQPSHYWLVIKSHKPVAYFTLPKPSTKECNTCHVHEHGGIFGR